MSWWKTGLYDTCSIITLDKILQERPGLSRHLPKKVLALEDSLSPGQMREETAKRIRGRIEHTSLPPSVGLASLLSSAGLPRELSEAEKLVFATATHFKLAVVTEDRRLARAVKLRQLQVGNVALILRELVESAKLAPAAVEKLLQGLAERNDFLLGIPNPTWGNLESYTFPG